MAATPTTLGSYVSYSGNATGLVNCKIGAERSCISFFRRTLVNLVRQLFLKHRANGGFRLVAVIRCTLDEWPLFYAFVKPRRAPESMLGC